MNPAPKAMPEPLTLAFVSSAFNGGDELEELHHRCRAMHAAELEGNSKTASIWASAAWLPTTAAMRTAWRCWKT